MKKNNLKRMIYGALAAVMSLALLSGCGTKNVETVIETTTEKAAAETSSESTDGAQDTASVGFGLGSTGEASDAVMLEDIPVVHNTNFGGMNMEIAIDEFNDAGFCYGDSVRITLSNGKVYEDIPYFDGYHTRTGELVLCAYPGYTSIHFTRNNSGDIWDEGDAEEVLFTLGEEPESDLWTELGLSEDEETLTATIEVTDAGLYIDTENAMSLSYYDDRERYDSDIIFANFRTLSCGNIKEGTVYRSASPCNNEHNRASYVDALAQENGINFILNLADNEEEVAGYMEAEDFNSPYFESLLDAGKVSLIDLTAAYRTENFINKTAEGFIAMSEAEPPYLFHCTEGKDRTGFVAILIESLCGATYDEMKDDYMVTYFNYYGVDEESTPETYAAIVDVKFNDMVFYLENLEYGDDAEETENVDFAACARDYLRMGGMTDEQIDTLVGKISK